MPTMTDREEVEEFFQDHDRDYDERLTFEEFLGEESHIEKSGENITILTDTVILLDCLKTWTKMVTALLARR